MWYSFYAAGTDMTSLAACTFSYAAGDSLDEAQQRRPVVVKESLLSELKSHSFLLVLDGLERRLAGYGEPSSSTNSSDRSESIDHHLDCVTPSDDELLYRLD